MGPYKVFKAGAGRGEGAEGRRIMVRRSIALATVASCLEAASAFSTVGIGSVTRAKIPARSMTSLRGGAGLTQTKMAGSAHDFKLPLVGAFHAAPTPAPTKNRFNTAVCDVWLCTSVCLARASSGSPAPTPCVSCGNWVCPNGGCHHGRLSFLVLLTCPVRTCPVHEAPAVLTVSCECTRP
jgi:hypothetical protein